MRLILQTANVVSDAKNCLYPNHVEVTDGLGLQQAVKMDHVCAEYKGNYRNVSNFIRSNVVVMDCDNDHSEEPADWITPGKLEEMIPDVSYAIAFSRNHMKVKDGRAARPKFHVYFEIEPTEDAGYYAALKAAIKKAYPFFDGNALDAARFIFGAETGDAVWHEGWMTIDEMVQVDMEESQEDKEASEPASQSGPILAGNRNNAMSRFASKVLKRYGKTEKAYEAYLEHSKKCDPPLEDEELKTIWNSAVKFYEKKVSTQEGYVDPDTYNDEFGSESLKPEDYSDMGQAKVFVREFGDELKFTDATDFLRYNGSFWDENSQASISAVEEFLDMQLVDARASLNSAFDALAELANVEEEDVKTGGKTLDKALASAFDNQIPENVAEMAERYQAAKGYYAFVMKYRNYKYIVSTQNAAKPMVAMDINAFDANENLLNTPDGTYDISKGLDGRQEHNPDDLITRIADCGPGEKGTELWKAALQTFFCGNVELIEYVQETVGLAAIGRVYQEALIIAYGEGRNGKSTFWNTVARVMGTYSGTMSADTLTAGCRRNVMPEIAELKGKRLVIAAELEEGTRLSTSVLKKLCSTDLIHAEKKFKQPHSFRPTHTVVLYTNHLPKVSATDDGTWRRLIVIPFHAKIEGKSDIKNYADFLYENAGSAIMSWIIEGAKKAIDKEFHIEKPKIVEDAIAEYRGMNDWLSQFLDDCCDVGEGLEQKSGELYEEYRAYCLRTGEYPRNSVDFASTLDKAGFIRKRKKTGVWVQGMQLKNEDFAD